MGPVGKKENCKSRMELRVPGKRVVVLHEKLAHRVRANAQAYVIVKSREAFCSSRKSHPPSSDRGEVFIIAGDKPVIRSTMYWV